MTHYLFSRYLIGTVRVTVILYQLNIYNLYVICILGTMYVIKYERK